MCECSFQVVEAAERKNLNSSRKRLRVHEPEKLEDSRILIVGQDPAGMLFIVGLLKYSGFKNVRSTSELKEVPPIFRSWSPDLVVLELDAHIAGLGVLAELTRVKDPDDYVPILASMAEATREARHEALEGGAADVMPRPGDAKEILLHIKSLLRMRKVYQKIRDQNAMLEEKVRERTKELKEAHVEVVRRLARVAEYRDDDTGRHAQRVGDLSAEIAENLGLSSPEVETIRLAATLHDIGKVAISDRVLLKPWRLTKEEFDHIKTHAQVGSDILKGSSCQFLQAAETIARTHHERWDGRGYPNGLKGEAIPLHGRIVAVADVFDALTSDRSYKSAMSRVAAIDEIARNSGTQFDPQVVEAFLRAQDRQMEELPVAA